jgi:phage-related protein (TIGR01555 family)
MNILQEAKRKGISIIDGWANILTGFGTGKDARTAARVTWNKMSEIELEQLYAGAKMARKIVDLPIKTALKNGYKLTGIEKEQEQAIKKRAQELYFDEQIQDAAIKGRLYGGAAILKVYNDSNEIDQPINGRGELKSLVVLNRFELWTEWQYIQKDILSPDFRTPKYYRFMGRGDAEDINRIIHFSRIARFEGELLPDRLFEQNSYWHDSVIAPIYDAIRNYYDAHDGASGAIKDLSVAIFKIKNLSEMIAGDCDDKVRQRLEIVNLTKSILKAVALDADGEEFKFETRSMAGVAELLEKVEDKLAAESEMPSTVLFGHSPKGGLGQSGDHDTNNWFNFVHGVQSSILKPPMLEILKEIAEDLKIDSKDLDLEFEKLETEREKDVVELRVKQAEIDDKYTSMGVLDPSEVRESRFGGHEYSIETTIDESVDVRASGLEAEKNLLKQMLEMQNKPEGDIKENGKP